MIRAALPLAVLASVLLLGGCGGDESSSGNQAPVVPDLTLCGPITIAPYQIGDVGGLYIQGLNIQGPSGSSGVDISGLDLSGDIIITGYHRAVAPAPAAARVIVSDDTSFMASQGIDISLGGDAGEIHIGTDCSTPPDTDPEEEVQDSFLYITADGLPDHDTGNFPNSENPYAISEQPRTFRVSVPPVLAEETTVLLASRFDGVLANGVPVQMREATCVGSGACGIFPGTPNPMHNPAMYGLDTHNAHVLADGSYHYHADPHALYDDSGATAFQIIGVAADGFPIFGPWIDDGGVIRKATSSYVMLSGPRVVFSPPFGFHDGAFIEDYEYVDGLGDLDECNGMMVNGVYGYFVTDTFPYIMNCLRGTPDPSFDLNPTP